MNEKMNISNTLIVFSFKMKQLTHFSIFQYSETPDSTCYNEVLKLVYYWGGLNCAFQIT